MAPRAPHVGLSKNRRPPSLLKTVNGQQVNRSATAYVPPQTQKRPPTNNSSALLDFNCLVKDENINGPPLDSDEDGEEGTETVKGHDTSDLPTLDIDRPDSSDEEDSKTVDIRPTDFQPGSRRSQRSGSQSTATKKTEDEFEPIRESKAPSDRRRARRGSLPNETPNRSRRTVASGYTEGETIISSLGSHLTDDLGFTSTGKPGRPRGSQRKRDRQYVSSQMRSSPEQSFKNPPAELQPHTPEKRGFKVPEIGISPSPRFQMRSVSESVTSSPDIPGVFQVPLGISPSKSESTKCHSPIANVAIGDDELSDLAMQFSPELPLRKKRLLGDIGKELPSPGFLIPDIVRDILKDEDAKLDTSKDSLNLGSADTESLRLEESQFPQSPEAARNTCPMCGDCVDAEFLHSYNNGKWMNTRMQARFCQAHKRATAQKDWHAHGYPTIDWSRLDARIQKHHAHLRELLEGAASYYRNVLDENVKAGKRTLAQSLRSDDELLPGYYGSRGLRVMSENIMKKFSPLLRRIAVKDRLMSSRGVVGYVQAVLVPELAVLLICEDMDVGVENGRSIMVESAAAGDLVHEEEADVLVRREDDPENDNWAD